MPLFLALFSHLDSGVEMGPEIYYPYPRLGPWAMVSGLVAGWPLFPQDRTEIAHQSLAINGVLFLGPNRG